MGTAQHLRKRLADRGQIVQATSPDSSSPAPPGCLLVGFIRSWSTPEPSDDSSQDGTSGGRAGMSGQESEIRRCPHNASGWVGIQPGL